MTLAFSISQELVAISMTSAFQSLADLCYLGVLTDDAHGMFSSDKIYSDLNVAQLETLPETQPHRLVDLALVKADKGGKNFYFISQQRLIRTKLPQGMLKPI
jgi:hypothetical protein